jgi:hypothetical protein
VHRGHSGVRRAAQPDWFDSDCSAAKLAYRQAMGHFGRLKRYGKSCAVFMRAL